MLVNRRQSERRQCRNFAKIQFGTGTLPRDCTITDISAGGVEGHRRTYRRSSEFTIILSEGRPRQCSAGMADRLRIRRRPVRRLKSKSLSQNIEAADTLVRAQRIRSNGACATAVGYERRASLTGIRVNLQAFLASRRLQVRKCPPNRSQQHGYARFLCVDGIVGDYGPGALQLSEPMACGILRDRWARNPRKAAPSSRRAKWNSIAIALAPIRGYRRDVAVWKGASGYGCSDPRRSPCSSRPRSPTRPTRPSLRVMGARWPTTAISNKPSMCWPRP